jgi:hypothetical protein
MQHISTKAIECRAGLTQLIRFLVMELTHPGSNPKFDVSVVFTANYSFSGGGDISIDSETLLVTEFVTTKIKSAQSFKYAHKDRMCVRVFIGMSAHICMSINGCTVFL